MRNPGGLPQASSYFDQAHFNPHKPIPMNLSSRDSRILGPVLRILGATTGCGSRASEQTACAVMASARPPSSGQGRFAASATPGARRGTASEAGVRRRTPRGVPPCGGVCTREPREPELQRVIPIVPLPAHATGTMLCPHPRGVRGRERVQGNVQGLGYSSTILMPKIQHQHKLRDRDRTLSSHSQSSQTLWVETPASELIKHDCNGRDCFLPRPETLQRGRFLPEYTLDQQSGHGVSTLGCA